MKTLRLSHLKRSRRYLLATLLCLYAGVFVFFGVNRATDDMELFPAPEVTRISDAELAQLTNFSALELEGNFEFEIVFETTHSVQFFPLPGDERRGSLEAKILDGQVLHIKGFINQGNNNSRLAKIRIGMPELSQVSARYTPAVRIQGFDQRSISLKLEGIGQVSLTGNHFNLLEINSSFVREISLAGTSAASENLKINGQTQITR